MDYSEKTLWQIIDGDVTATQHAAFHDACKRCPGLTDRYSRMLKMHQHLQSYFAASEADPKDLECPAITPLRQQDSQQH